MTPEKISDLAELRGAKFTGALSVIKGGTGATDAEGARANLYAAALVHSHDLATSSTPGFMSAADKAKLDSITPPSELAYAIGQQSTTLSSGMKTFSFNFASSGVSKHNCSTSVQGLVIEKSGRYDISITAYADIDITANNTDIRLIAGSLDWTGSMSVTKTTLAYSTKVNLSAGNSVVLIGERNLLTGGTITYDISVSVEQVS